MKFVRYLSSYFLLGFGFALLSVLALHGQTAQTHTAALFSAGVSYTSVDGQGAPKFPNMDVVFNLSQPNGQPVLVHPDELALYSEGREVGECAGIRTFDRTGYGASTVIALDAAGALHTLTASAVNLAVFTVVHDGVKQDTTAVTSVAEDFFVDLPFHPGPRHWKANAPLFPARGKETHLYDGLLQAASLFNASVPRRRILLVITDSHDAGSEHTPLDLLARAKSLGIEIDAIAINADTSATSAATLGSAASVLQQLALATGGAYVLAHNGDELQQMIALHLSRVRATPVAEFQLSHIPADGQVHALQLRWITGNQATPVFLTTPDRPSFSFGSLSKTSLFSNPLLANPWILGFGACFVAGMGLLLLSMIPSHTRAARPQPAIHTSDPLFKPPSEPYPASPTTAPSLPSFGKTGGQQSYFVEEGEREKRAFAQRFDAAPQGPYARLVIRNNALAGKVVPMTRNSFSLGALPGNNLALPGDLTISGTHLRFYWENATLTVEDNHSTNGTWLNRQRLSAGRHALKPGDEIGLGQTFLVVERA
ncbi:MAG TPA: FHA domain-containing protein [Acidobacteriaceae bacterium]|nr:FHA domain-containing protein [Acidobacteriaceae bacterium]